jgi:hypothetical protein
MTYRSLDIDEQRDFLLRNWMTHDALWYREAATQLGMEKASPMNLRVCRELGQIETKRFIKLVGASPPKNIEEFRELFEAAGALLVPPFMDFDVEYRGEDTFILFMKDCFAHRGMEKVGLLSEYECGIFIRIEGWFDAMELKYERTPDLSRCLKYTEGECVITVKFNFG